MLTWAYPPLRIISLFDIFRCIYTVIYQIISNTEVKWEWQQDSLCYSDTQGCKLTLKKKPEKVRESGLKASKTG